MRIQILSLQEIHSYLYPHKYTISQFLQHFFISKFIPYLFQLTSFRCATPTTLRQFFPPSLSSNRQRNTNIILFKIHHSDSPMNLHPTDDLEDFCDTSNHAPNTPNTPRVDTVSQCSSYRHNPIKDIHMFSSPINKTINVAYLTPIVHNSFGFTPYTPVEKSTDREYAHHSPYDMKRNIHQILDFDQPISRSKNKSRKKQRYSESKDDMDYQDAEEIDQKPKRKRKNQHIFQTPTNKRKEVEECTTVKRTQRKRKQIEMTDFIKTPDHRSERGLRNLAMIVKTVAYRLSGSSSKEIADAIIEEIKQDKQVMPREMLNIKRRVYDALKVLISADVLIKDSNNKIAKTIEFSNASFENYRDSLKQRLEILKKTIQIKSEKVIAVNNKWVVREQLIETNKKRSNTDIGQRVYFPFFAIVLKNDNLNYLKMSKGNEKVKGRLVIGFKNPRVRIMGDLDVLLEMRIMEEQQRTANLDQNKEEGEIKNCLDCVGEKDKDVQAKDIKIKDDKNNELKEEKEKNSQKKSPKRSPLEKKKASPNTRNRRSPEEKLETKKPSPKKPSPRKSSLKIHQNKKSN